MGKKRRIPIDYRDEKVREEILERQRRGMWTPDQIASFARHFRLRPGMRLLDAGCGHGYCLRTYGPHCMPGGELVGFDREKFLGAVTAGEEPDVMLQMDGLRERLRVITAGHRSRYQQEVEAQCFNGPPIVNVTLDQEHLAEAISCCGSGLIRIEIAHRDADQAIMPVVIRGEDEQFKAVLQPQQGD